MLQKKIALNPGSGLLSKKTIILITITLLALVVYPEFVWRTLSTKPMPHPLKIQEFLTYFPPFLRNIGGITFLKLLLSVLGIVLTIMWMDKERGFWQVIPGIIFIMFVLITLLTLF